MSIENEFANIYAKIWERASADEEFRKKMMENPVAAFNEVMPQPLPESFTIKVIEPDPAYTTTFLLPPEKGELSDDDIDSVAGGFGVTAALSALGLATTVVPALFKGLKKIFK